MRFLLFLTINILLASTVWAAPFSSEPLPESKGPLVKTTSSKPRGFVSRGPFQTRSVKNEVMKVTFQDGNLGPNWTEISITKRTFKNDTATVSIGPTLMMDAQGRTGVGANIQLQLNDIVEIGHTSHIGGLERHMTSVTLAPRSPISLRALRISGSIGVATRVGPTVKLGKNLRVWYGVGTGGASDLVLATGNLRF